eukprot:TRINITY_DN58357_c0_g1_i1.p1 TRINITY_DN58357_c0_g1~~TRINITY_DN58357_c0_g1_i1.p1  ORF type:complete len:350 (+),score=43.01 TRINITY_DN58357_c0_g1_i1:54-1103(+)
MYAGFRTPSPGPVNRRILRPASVTSTRDESPTPAAPGMRRGSQSNPPKSAAQHNTRALLSLGVVSGDMATELARTRAELEEQRRCAAQHSADAAQLYKQLRVLPKDKHSIGIQVSLVPESSNTHDKPKPSKATKAIQTTPPDNLLTSSETTTQQKPKRTPLSTISSTATKQQQQDMLDLSTRCTQLSKEVVDLKQQLADQAVNHSNTVGKVKSEYQFMVDEFHKQENIFNNRINSLQTDLQKYKDQAKCAKHDDGDGELSNTYLKQLHLAQQRIQDLESDIQQLETVSTSPILKFCSALSSGVGVGGNSGIAAALTQGKDSFSAGADPTSGADVATQQIFQILLGLVNK